MEIIKATPTEIRNQLVLESSRINGDFRNKHILSIDQFEREDLDILFPIAKEFKNRMENGNKKSLLEICKGELMAVLFYEPSTRTDMSHQASMKRLGGEVIAASNGIEFSSVLKGEDLADTVRAVGCYADIIVQRHHEAGSSLKAAYYLDKLSKKIGRRMTLINGGDGAGEHPTQGLLDLFTIEEFKGKIDGLNITIVGDLKNGRTVHSLTKLASKNGHNVNFSFVSPHSLKMPTEIINEIQTKGFKFYETDNLLDILPQSDVIYWTRIQEERFDNKEEYEAIKNSFVMTPKVFSYAKSDAILMHPLPRKHEMGTQEDHDILDDDPRSVYFHQMENGMYVRMALLSLILGNY